MYFLICLSIIWKFLFALNNLIEKNFFLLIIFKVDKPIEPVDPNIEINFFHLVNNHKKINPRGKPKNIPSSLSNIPPWPGKIFPVSFILIFLFK